MAQRAGLSTLPVLPNAEEIDMKLLLLAATVFCLLLNATPAAAAKSKVQCRDSKTGAYVSAAYAKKYPGLTVCEQRK
jgi:hypothetical protein